RRDRRVRTCSRRSRRQSGRGRECLDHGMRNRLRRQNPLRPLRPLRSLRESKPPRLRLRVNKHEERISTSPGATGKGHEKDTVRETRMAKPLKGVKVLDMGTFITGPAAAVLLADLGAEVIKVEMPGAGDPFRSFKGDLYSPHYQTYNRNKKSVELNTKQPEDLAAFDALVREADVFIQNFRPGVADRLGVGSERLRGLNPRLIYCDISGFGADGPWKDRPAFDTVSQAVTGFLRLLVNPGNPRVVGPAIGDAVTGFYAAYGVLAALYEREKTGKGRLVET